jgi:hypothetical protein
VSAAKHQLLGSGGDGPGFPLSFYRLVCRLATTAALICPAVAADPATV